MGIVRRGRVVVVWLLGVVVVLEGVQAVMLEVAVAAVVDAVVDVEAEAEDAEEDAGEEDAGEEGEEDVVVVVEEGVAELDFIATSFYVLDYDRSVNC